MATQVQQVRPTYEQLEAQVADLQRQLAESREQQNERPQELTEALEKQTAVARILHISSRSPTHLQPVFAAIVEDAARLCGATSAAICFLRDGQLSVAKSA